MRHMNVFCFVVSTSCSRFHFQGAGISWLSLEVECVSIENYLFKLAKMIAESFFFFLPSTFAIFLQQ